MPSLLAARLGATGSTSGHHQYFSIVRFTRENSPVTVTQNDALQPLSRDEWKWPFSHVKLLLPHF